MPAMSFLAVVWFMFCVFCAGFAWAFGTWLFARIVR